MKNKKVIKKSLIFFKDLKFKLLILLVLQILIGIVSFTTPIFEAKLIEAITTFKLFKTILFLAVIYLSLELLYLFLSKTSVVYYLKNIKSKILFSIRKYVIDNIFELETINFDKNTTGYFEERIIGDTNIIAKTLNSAIQRIVEMITRIGVVIYIFFINWIIGLIFLFIIILTALLKNKVDKTNKENLKIARQNDDTTYSFITETIRGIRDIKLLNFKRYAKKEVMDKLDENNNKYNEFQIYDYKTWNHINYIIIIGTVLIILIGVKFVSLGLMSLADLMVIYLYRVYVFSFMDLYSVVKDCIRDYTLSFERIFDLCDDKKHQKDKFGNIHIDNFKGKIEFKNVSFGYSKKEVIKDLNLVVKPKETIALVGSSGSGKTTLLNLITKSYDINSGELLLDNKNINDLDEKTIRENISIITQNPYIFNMSIEDNLKLVKPNATKKEIEEVCKIAKFYDYVMSLPDKFNTIIGEGGINLSGGQRQRLAIARTLLKGAKILLFDEATSALDNITQKEIQESIDNISSDYTIIIVAHRLSTIINCEKIYLLDNGKIVDNGTHKELLKRNKKYKELYNLESKDN